MIPQIADERAKVIETLTRKGLMGACPPCSNFVVINVGGGGTQMYYCPTHNIEGTVLV